MAKEQALKRPGNPNFAKKSVSSEKAHTDDLNKQYIFQLLKTHEKQKPVDGKTGELTGSPYQPFFAVVNSGLAWDAEYIPEVNGKPRPGATKGASRRWRYLYNYPTIWVDEQIDPTPTKEDLAAAENDLTFRFGVLRVFGHEKMKLKALQLNNAFQDCQRPLKNVPKEYELLNQDKIDQSILEFSDEAFEAEKAAREATTDKMYAIAYYFGIDLSKSEAAIRNEFINKARTMPKVFNREFVNAKNEYKYLFLNAIADNIISATMIPGKLQFVETNTAMMDLNSTDPAEELASLCMANDNKAMSIYNKLLKMYNDQVEA